MADRHPAAREIAFRARRIVDERIGPSAIVSGPRLADGHWEVAVYWGSEARWTELVRLRFDARGRLLPVSWPPVYDRLAAVLDTDPAVLNALPRLPEPTLAAEQSALAEIEPVTGLPSLGTLELRLRREIARWHRTGESFCVAWIEVAPRSPSVEFTYRHLLALWRLAARRLSSTVRAEDLLAAAAPCRFALLLVGRKSEARAPILRLVQRLDRPFRLRSDGPPIHVALAVGLAEVRAGDTPASLLTRARRNLHPWPAHC